MNEKKSALISRLKQYSILASPFIAVSSAVQAQVVYRDLNPDVDLTTNAGELNNYNLDLNNDGVIDFVFGVLSRYQTDTSGSKYNKAGVKPDTMNGNGIMGYVHTNVAKYYYASALSTNQDINNTKNFWEYSGGYGTFFLYYADGVGFGQWKNVTNKYMGFRFKDSGGNTHYGWMRMDITVYPVELVIKDLAYQSTPDAGIKAGEGGPSGIETANSEHDVSIFSFGKKLFIESSLAEAQPMQIEVMDVSGKIILAHQANDRNVQLSLNNVSDGIYLVKVSQNGNEYIRKVVLY